jgi:hypothetical protein
VNSPTLIVLKLMQENLISEGRRRDSSDLHSTSVI